VPSGPYLRGHSLSASTASDPMREPLEPRRERRLIRRVVPPITHRVGVVQCEGLEILDEFSGEGAIVLWHSCRDLALRISGGSERVGLFASGSYEARMALIESVDEAAFDPIKPALRVIAQILRPEAVDVELVGTSSDTVAAWAEQQVCLGTALEFAQVAALAAPQRPAFAVRAARIMRIRAEYERAVTWFDNALYGARQVKDWEVYSQAYAGLGCLFMQRGNYPRARRALHRALGVARRHGLKERIAAAYHNLFAVEAAAGNWQLAEDFAARALRYYPPHARGLPRLARDLGFRWILRGSFHYALPLAQEALAHFSSPADRGLVLSDVARAGAACGELEIAEDAWAQAYALTLTASVAPFEADILLNLTHASISRQDEIRARITGHRAIEAARKGSRSELLLEAEAALDSLRSELMPHLRSPIDQDVQAAREELATSFVSTLRRVRSGTRFVPGARTSACGNVT
jgi:tetratricopeptide (TPR) repeat protein